MRRIESRLNYIEKIVKPKNEKLPVIVIGDVRDDGDGLPEDYEEWLTYQAQKDSGWPIIIIS
jgi:hypothetical protein